MATEKNLNNLIINKVENQAVYDYMKTNNLINADELYFISGADDNATETESGLMSAEDKIKLDGIEEGAQVNVQSDWNVTDTSSDAYIKNKPAALPANGGNAETVNGHTVNTDVPTNAIFTDTIYIHPNYTSRSSALYKITVDDTGHVSGATKAVKSDITALGIPAQDTTYSEATSTSAGLMSAADKTRLDGLIASGGEANQNAFSNVAVGSVTVTADNTTDTLTLEAGDNIIISADSTNDKITIAATDTTYSAAGSSLGLVKSGGDVNISNGVITVNDNSHSHTIDNIDNLQSVLNGKVDAVDDKGLSTNDLTATLKSNYDAAYMHSQQAHAPADAEKNVIVGIQKNGTDLSVNSSTRKVNITVPTKTSDLTNDSNFTTTTALDTKVDKVTGKGLSTNDYTTEEKNKLSNIEDGANKTIIDAALSSTSTNPVQNKVINTKFNSVQSDIVSRVPSSRTINGKALTTNITLSASDVGALPSSTTIPSIEGLATETYVNNKVAGLATETYVNNKVAGLVDSAPSTLDTLNELAAALGDDPNFATTIATQIGGKVDKVEGKSLSTNDYTTAEKQKLANIANGANNYTLPVATSSALGGIKSGTDITIDSSGNVSVNDDSHNHIISNVDGLQSALDGKVNKIDGKGLSTNDFTTEDKTKLAGIEEGANAYTHPSYTAITGVPTTNQTPAFGEAFNVSQPISDATGHIAAINNRTIVIPDMVATTSASGLMSASDKTKLDRLPIQNLIKYPYYSKNVYLYNGLIFRVGEDGSVTVNGTATAATYFNFSYRASDTAITLTPGQNYYLSGCPSGGGTGKYSIVINYTSASGSSPNLAIDSGNGVLFTATQSAINNLYGCYIYIGSGQVCNDLVFRPMLTMGEIIYNYTSPITSTAINTIDNIPPEKNGNMSYSDILSNASLKDSILTYSNLSKNWKVIKFFDDHIIATKNYSVDITQDMTFGTIPGSQKITLNLMEPFGSAVTIVGTADSYGASIINTNLSNNGVSISYRVLVPSNTFPSKVYVRLAIIGSKRSMPTSLSRSNTTSNQAKAVNIAKSYYDVAVAKKKQGIQEFGYGANWSYHSSKVLRNENGCGMMECDTFVLMVALGIPYDKSPYNSDWNTNIYKGIYPKTSSPFNIALNEANANFDQADLIVNPDGNYWSFDWMKQHISNGTTIFDNSYGDSAISDTGEMAWDFWRRGWVFSDINSSESGDIVLFRSKANIGEDYIGFDLIVHVGIISIENNERWVYHVSGLSETDGLIVGKIRLNDIILGRGYTSDNYYFARPDYSLNEGV